MSLKKTIVAGMAVAAMLLSVYPALAQDATTPAAETPAARAADTPAAPAADAPAATTPASAPAPDSTPNDNWLKVCDPLEGGKKACVMRQVVVVNGTFLGSFLLRDDPGQESRLLAVAAVPLGVLLPFGLTWQIDGGKPIRVPFMLCDPQACATQLVINEAYVNSLKKGGKLKLTAKNRQNQDLVIEIDLAGFTAAYDSETALTFDQYNQANSTPNALERVLQDRAEALRRQLAGEGGTTPAPADDTTPAPADGTTPPADATTPAPATPAAPAQ